MYIHAFLLIHVFICIYTVFFFVCFVLARKFSCKGKWRKKTCLCRAIICPYKKKTLLGQWWICLYKEKTVLGQWSICTYKEKNFARATSCLYLQRQKLCKGNRKPCLYTEKTLLGQMMIEMWYEQLEFIWFGFTGDRSSGFSYNLRAKQKFAELSI